ncbi:MAG: T9SS type A sorting domain-containing protein [Chitinophagales bacterium]
MNKYLYFIFLISCSIITNAQTTFNTTYNIDRYSEVGLGLLPTIDTSYMLYGTYLDRDVLPGWQLQGFYIAKVNEIGEVIWLKKYSNNKGIYIGGYNSLISTKDGGFASAGSFREIDTEMGGYKNADYFLVKFNSEGDTLWVKTYGSELAEGAIQCKETLDGGFAIIGSKVYNEINKDAYLIRTDKDGDLLWEQNYGGAAWDGGVSVEITEDNGFLIGGGWDQNIGEAEGLDGAIISVDSLGSINWLKKHGEEEAHCLMVSFHSTISGFITHSCKLYITEDDYWTPAYISRLDENAEVDWLWESPVQSDYKVVTKMIEQEDGSIVFSGYHLFPNPIALAWGWIGKLSLEGELLWEKEYFTDENGYNVLYDIVPTSDGGFLATGNAMNPLDSLNEEGRNIWLLKVNCEGDLEHSNVCTDIDVGIEDELLLKQNSLHIFPNPSQNQVQFAWNTPATQLSVYNLTGQLMEQVPLDSGQKALQLEVADWRSGVYFAVLEGAEGAILGREKLVVR